jgi:DNA-binding NarL/FixJ family response regulator
MVDKIALVHALTRLEVLLRTALTPQQYHTCASLLPALRSAVGALEPPNLPSIELKFLTDATLRQRYHLTEREVEVLQLLLLGQSNTGVAHTLHVSEHTARHHTERVLRKVHVHSRAQLAAAIGGR